MAPRVEVVNLRETKPMWEHLADEHAVGYADRLSEAEQVAKHDKDHRSGSWRHEHPR
jgi:hypothetical protein